MGAKLQLKQRNLGLCHMARNILWVMSMSCDSCLQILLQLLIYVGNYMKMSYTCTVY